MGLPIEGDAARQAKKSFRALKSHIDKTTKSRELVYLVVNTANPTTRKDDYIPRIIPVRNRLGTTTETSILLITKDPATTYRDTLRAKDSPTEDVFSEIMSLKKLKSISKNPKKVKKLFNEYDLVLADHRLHHLLPSVLGATFYKGHKKLPRKLQMAKPDPDALLTKTSKSHKLKDERCDPKYVMAQVKSIVKNTSFLPSTGTSMSIRIGYSDMKTDQLIENANDVLEYLSNPKYKPVGGIISRNDIRALHTKTAESISLPLSIEK
ncbi:unnamed protein product [Kuraishia capsulata CBS 1993]|uniref:Ribosomal protein L1 n=1 Tax=Kuraishia capsulata CBS 1993 TaxID=1382522 RepID=W6MU61_9ASCO|nr:uncharacterized protein KUCA_T00001420001 [Kuraishia capsulata CBS 1993]CDK25450.1 unnamed protein product [Kuraishia capsulata CBS 1993]